MADAVPTSIRTKQRGVKKFQWSLGTAQNGVPVKFDENVDISVSVFGTFGAAVTFEWSNDERANPSHSDHANAEWHAAHHAADGTTAFSKTADGGEQIFEVAQWYRPVAASGVSAVTVVAVGVK